MTQPTGRPQAPGKYEVVSSLGETFKLSHITPGIRLEFAMAAEAAALARIERRRGNAAQYLTLKKQLNDEILAGAYDWGSPDEGGMGSAINRAIQDGEGPATMAKLLLREHHGEVDVSKFAKAWAANMQGFSDAVWRCLDPNSDSPPASEPTGMTGMTQTVTTSPIDAKDLPTRTS